MEKTYHQYMAKVLDEQRKEYIKTLLRLTDQKEILNQIFLNLPVIIDPFSEDGEKALASFKKNGAIKVLKDPFIQGCIEIKMLVASFAGMEKHSECDDVDDVKKNMIDQLRKRLMVNVSEPLLEPFVEIMRSKKTIIDDLVEFLRKMNDIGISDEELEETSRWIWYPHDHRVIRFLDPNRYRILLEGMSLGKLPMWVVEKLKDLKIYVLGAKHAEDLIKTLVCHGAEHIVFFDDSCNGSDMSAFQLSDSRVEDVETPWVIRLQNELYRMNPYGFFFGFSTKVVNQVDHLEQDIISLQALIKEADVIIDSMGNIVTSIDLRTIMGSDAPETPIVFYMDNGIDSMAGIEIPGDQKYFNLDTSIEDWQKFKETIISAGETDLKQVEHGADLNIWNGNISTKGLLSTLLHTAGVFPDLIQGRVLPETTRLALKLIIEYMSGNQNVKNHNFNPLGIHNILAEQVDPLEQVTVREVCEEFFAPVRTFTPEFKAQVVLELLKGNKTTEQICREYQLKIDDVLEWRISFIENAAKAFSNN